LQTSRCGVNVSVMHSPTSHIAPHWWSYLISPRLMKRRYVHFSAHCCVSVF